MHKVQWLVGALTNTVTHTGEQADGINGGKSAKDLILLSGNSPKALEMKGLDGLNYLAGMRSAVRIRPAAPEKPSSHMVSRFFLFSIMSRFSEPQHARGVRKMRIFIAILCWMHYNEE